MQFLLIALPVKVAETIPFDCRENMTPFRISFGFFQTEENMTICYQTIYCMYEYTPVGDILFELNAPAFF